MYQGIRKDMPGIRRATRMSMRRRFWVNRAMEYAAGRPIRREKNTEQRPTILEFFKYSRKFCSPKTFSKFRRVGVKIIFGGHEIISTWVLKDDINIHRKGKSIGITISRIRRTKAIFKNKGFFINVFLSINFRGEPSATGC
jgi:hypothetical protein